MPVRRYWDRANNQTKHNRNLYNDKVSKIQKVAEEIVATKLIKEMFSKTKPLFQWSELELRRLNIAVNREIEKRRRPIKFKGGVRITKMKEIEK